MRQLAILFSFFTFVQVLAPEPVAAQNASPYETRFWVDAPITAAGAASSYYHLLKINEKHTRDSTEAANLYLHKDDVPKFDRFSAGWYNPDARAVSDVFFYSSFATPFLLLLDKDISGKAGQVGVLYLETMAITGTLFTAAAGNINRYRPLAYGGPDVPLDEKRHRNTQNSFFAGHTAAAASATFFVAKVFHDFHPDSDARKYVWAAGAAVPAVVGYCRLRAGKHFLSDNLLGYALGAGTGILVPQLHKKANSTGLSMSPVIGPYQGVALTYRVR